MEKKEFEQITFAIYKGHSRHKVIKMSAGLLKVLIVANSLIIVSCFILFPSFLYQWSLNDTIRKKNEILEREISFHKSSQKKVKECETAEPQAAVNKELESVVASGEDTETDTFEKIAKLDELGIAIDNENREMHVKFTIQNNSESGDLVSGYIIVRGASKNFITSYPPALNKPGSEKEVDYASGEHFSIRVYKRVLAKLKMPPDDQKYDYINILIYSLDGNKLLDKVYRVNEYLR
ncbi:MAG: hypothetical protein JXA66_03070 [Oligoflexia bacterium]|nr:hypothetical protein [Oligoflexia bacterium]